MNLHNDLYCVLCDMCGSLNLSHGHDSSTLVGHDWESFQGQNSKKSITVCDKCWGQIEYRRTQMEKRLIKVYKDNFMEVECEHIGS